MTVREMRAWAKRNEWAIRCSWTIRDSCRAYLQKGFNTTIVPNGSYRTQDSALRALARELTRIRTAK